MSPALHKARNGVISIVSKHAAPPPILGALQSAWPAYLPSPEFRTQSIEQAGVYPGRSATGHPALPLADAFIITPDCLADDHALSAVLDVLWEFARPALVLTETHDAARFGEGVLTIPHDTDPAHIAGILGAFLMRQPTVETMRRDLHTAQRFQGGLTGEINKLHEELRLAATVQQAFLPQTLPSVPGFDFRVFFRAAGYVSGDIYNIQRLDEQHFGIFIADAVGHGVPAALLTMVIARATQMKTITGNRYTIHSPSDVLDKLNAELIRHNGHATRFATAIYALVNIETRRVTLAGAGHPPALILAPGREPSPIETEGGLLGVFPEHTFPSVEFSLDEGEVLALYSDGFETAFPDNADRDRKGRALPTRYYLDRFTRLAEERNELGMSEAMRRFVDDIDSQAGSLHQVDDLTALFISPSAACPLDDLFEGRPATHAQR